MSRIEMILFGTVVLSLTLANVLVDADDGVNGTSVRSVNVSVDVGEALTADEESFFDFFVFSQIWPITSCDIWTDGRQSNTCYLPELIHGRWTVHGLWPSTDNGPKGPFNCNKTPFNPSALEPIRSELDAKWTNVHKNSPKNDFWQHEWSKHGTCAMQLESLDTEFKYFSKGLELNEEFDIGTMLSAAGIVPGEGYTGSQVLEQLTSALGNRPAIVCVKNRQPSSEEQGFKFLLSEIRICLDKEFKVIDCKSDSIQMCSRDRPINFYPRASHVRLFAAPEMPTLVIGVAGVMVATTVAVALLFFCYKKNSSRQRGYDNI